MSQRFRWLIIILVLLLPVIVGGAACSTKNQSSATLAPITIKMWGVWDEEDAYTEIFNSYKASHPNVKFEYTKFQYEEYRDQLLAAWARGEGPDIFAVPNSSLGDYRKFITPLPQTIEVPKLVTSKALGCKKETKRVTTKQRTYTADTLRSEFIPVVSEDVLFYDKDGNPQIYGLPFSTDNLVLYYNRDILNQARIALPPRNWNELVSQIPSLVKENEKGEIIQSAIALGTSKNIQRYTDLLSVLMMQDGATMGKMNDANVFQAVFDQSVKDADNKAFYSGAHALTFYTDFSNASKQAYTWNEDLPDSFEAFTQGLSAYFLGYAYHIPLIQKAAPTLNYDIAALPQVSLNQEINFANYWVQSVFVNSKNATQAWDFLYFATQAGNVQPYLKETVLPSALRSIINTQAEDYPQIDIFIKQSLTSSSWYHGKNYRTVDEAFKLMIDEVVKAETTPKDAVEKAAKTINQNERIAD